MSIRCNNNQTETSRGEIMEATSTSGSEAARLYQQRDQRLQDAIALRVPDRVPVVFNSGFWQAAYAGYTVREAMYDYRLNAAAWRKAALELQPDGIMAPLIQTALGPLLDALGWRPLRWPGHGVTDNATFQYLDQEVMKADEYGLFIEDPTHFYLTCYLPRVSEALAPLAKLPQFPRAQNLRLLPWFRVFADPEVTATLQKLSAIGAEAQRLWEHHAALQQELVNLGFPSTAAAGCPCPYDYFADYLRGSRGIMLDMYRRKDELLAAMEHLTPILSKSAVSAGTAGACNIIFMALHWGLDGFMSLGQFKTFYWPFLRRVMMAQIEAGVVPCVYWEGDCISRLETIADIPRGKAIYWFERTDLFRAKQVLGEVVCLRGGVPPSLLNVGTPEEVTARCRQVIERVGKGGGLILDGGGGGGIPDEARPENVKAMFRAVHEYGRYQ
jgi:hypothetical protein